jgi:hypothetical protein
MTSEEFGVVHIWGQGAWHDTVYIRGNRSGLERLKRAVDEALEAGVASTEAYVSDGEGYDIDIQMVSDEDAEMLGVPYFEDIACEDESRTDLIFPWKENVKRSVQSYLRTG